MVFPSYSTSIFFLNLRVSKEQPSGIDAFLVATIVFTKYILFTETTSSLSYYEHSGHANFIRHTLQTLYAFPIKNYHCAVFKKDINTI